MKNLGLLIVSALFVIGIWGCSDNKVNTFKMKCLSNKKRPPNYNNWMVFLLYYFMILQISLVNCTGSLTVRPSMSSA